MKSLPSLLLIMLLSFPLYSQSPIKFSGQIRPRVEVDNKTLSPGNKANTFISLRSRLNVSFSPLEDYSIFLQVQDSRIMGEESNTVYNSKNLDIKEAYFELKNIFNSPINVKAGRFAAAYGNERLFGAVDWSYIGRSFDGATGYLRTKDFNFDLFGFRETESMFPHDSADKNVVGLFSDIKAAEFLTVQPLFIWVRSTKQIQRDYYTGGLNLIAKYSGFRGEIEGAIQKNEVEERGGTAYLAAVNLFYKSDITSKPELSVGMDYLSGRRENNSYNAFNTLYATNHKFYGYMDMFVVFPNDNLGLGLKDFHGKITAQPLSGLSLYLAYHKFESEMEYPDLTEGAKNFGSEIDFTFNYKYNEFFTLQGGASAFFAGEILKARTGDDRSYWGYLMAIANF